MKTPYKLWLVRHAQPCIAPGVCYGSLDISAEVQATHQTAQALALVLPQDAEIWTSPLQRCELLAQCLCGFRPDSAYKTDVRLVEMNFGEWEGAPWADIPRAALDAWTADFGDHRFGGVESANAVLSRVAGALQSLSTLAPDRDVVWVTHAGVIRAATLLAQGVSQVQQASQWPSAAPGFGQWICWKVDSSHASTSAVTAARLVSLNIS